MTLSFTFEDNRTYHDDLLLELGDQAYRCDSYYLAGDDGPLFDLSAANARRSLVRLVEQWCAALANLVDGRMLYLPFEWDDERTGCIRCRRLGSDIELLVGDLPINGYFHSPRNITIFMACIADNSDAEPQDVPSTGLEPDKVVAGPTNYFRPKQGARPVTVEDEELKRSLDETRQRARDAV